MEFWFHSINLSGECTKMEFHWELSYGPSNGSHRKAILAFFFLIRVLSNIQNSSTHRSNPNFNTHSNVLYYRTNFTQLIFLFILLLELRTIFVSNRPLQKCLFKDCLYFRLMHGLQMAGANVMSAQTASKRTFRPYSGSHTFDFPRMVKMLLLVQS